MRVFALAAVVITLMGAAQTTDVPIPTAPTTWVTDNAGFISTATRNALDRQLADYNRSTGHQVIVWIGTTTGADSLEDWTIRAFTAWKVGRKGLDDGLALFIFKDDRKVRIEVGYGLEGQVTDAAASRIEREYIVPRLKAGDPDGAVTAGVQALLATISGTQAPQTAQPASNSISSYAVLQLIVWVFAVVLFIVLFIRSARYAGWTAYTIGSGRRSGGYGPAAWGGFIGGGFSGGDSGGSGGFSGGDSGGFSGGGGSGGGGGASASW